MTWKPHIDQVTAKANKVLVFLRRNLKNCPQFLKELAYTLLVRPKLEYCASIWDPYRQSKINQLEHTQHRAARFVLSKPWKRSERENQESTSSMVQSLGWETLQRRRRNARLTLMYKVYNNHVEVPQCYLPPWPSIDTHGTHDHSLRQMPCNIDAYKNSFFPRFVVDWNRLP